MDLKKALSNPLYKAHVRNKSLYAMDNKKDRWILVYYPIFENGKTKEFYDEPRALMQNIEKDGFWSKEVPLRYLKTLNQQS